LNLKKIAAKYAGKSEVFIASDGTPFFEESFAKAYADKKGLKVNKIINPIKKSKSGIKSNKI
tara:strand:- start:1037 stop:1222 length:186 start_codon:yes stop_codon:yes gene_type:complete